MIKNLTETYTCEYCGSTMNDEDRMKEHEKLHIPMRRLQMLTDIGTTYVNPEYELPSQSRGGSEGWPFKVTIKDTKTGFTREYCMTGPVIDPSRTEEQ